MVERYFLNIINNIKNSLQYNELIKNFNIVFFYILSIRLYYKSLEGCFGPDYACLTHEKIKFFYKKKDELILSCIFFSIITFFVIEKLFSNITYMIFLSFYLIIFITNQGSILSKHGTYNMVVFIVFHFFFLIIFFIFRWFYRNIKRKKFKIIIIVFIFIIFWPLLFFIFTKLGCKYWDVGLNEIKINNSKSENACYIKTPKYCTISILDNLLDLSKYIIKTCNNKRNSKKILEEYSKRTFGNRIAYPNTIGYSFFNDSIEKTFTNKILREIKTINKNDTNYEVTVEFDYEGNGNVIINVNPNQTLINERRKLVKKNKVKYENIYFIFIDSVSRNHFKRKFPKTVNLINSYIHNNKNKKEKYDSFQFLKYINFEAHTLNNMVPLFYGASLESKKEYSLLKRLKSKGYITCGGANICERTFFALTRYKVNQNMFEPYDHENYALFCDPNYNNIKVNSLISGPYSSFKRCLYGKNTFEYIFEYALKFLDSYINERKFLIFQILDGHEGSMEVIKYVDNYLFDFLQILFDKYMNDKSVILLFSDHGNQMPNLHYLLKGEDFIYEKTLGILFIILPENNNLNKESLIVNEQRFVTPFDIYNTAIDFINGNKSEYGTKGQSLFEPIDGLKRNCSLYENDFINMKGSCHCVDY